MQPSGRDGTKRSPFKICWITKLALQEVEQKGAAGMFNVSVDELTYAQVHRHFLQRGPFTNLARNPLLNY